MKNKGNHPPPIIHTRIPSSLQQVFIKSNRGHIVDVPPHSADVSICRNWHDISSSKRRARKSGASIQIREDKSARSARKITTFELPDGMADSATISDISSSDGYRSDNDSSIDSVDMNFLKQVMKMEVSPSCRWESGNCDASPQKRIVRVDSHPDMQMPPPQNRWIDGIHNVSPQKQRKPPRPKSPVPKDHTKVELPLPFPESGDSKR